MECQTKNNFGKTIVWVCTSCHSTMLRSLDSAMGQCPHCKSGCEAVDFMDNLLPPSGISVHTGSPGPIYEALCNLGDVNFLDHGGAIVYYNSGWQLDIIFEPAGNELAKAMWEIYTIELRRIEHGDTDWFLSEDNLSAVESFCGLKDGALLQSFKSGNMILRAEAYRDVGSHDGYLNFDSSPMNLSACEVYSRYNQSLDVPCLCSKCMAGSKHKGRCPKCLGDDFLVTSYCVEDPLVQVGIVRDEFGYAIRYSFAPDHGTRTEIMVVCEGCDHKFDLQSIMKP